MRRSGRSSMLAGLVALGTLAMAAPAPAAPGDLDQSFGSGGQVRLLTGDENLASIRGVAVQPDDRIVLSGSESPGNVFVMRLLADGSPDTSFGSGGRVSLALPGGFSEANALAIQPDGRIVFAGGAKGSADSDFLIGRLNPDGTPDASFGGGDGNTILPAGDKEDEARAVAIAADGRIAATGRSELGGKAVVGIALLLPDGTPDPGFDGDGTVTVSTAESPDSGVATEFLPDGRILIGDSSAAGGGKGFTVIQMLPTGLPDPAFGGGDGIAQIDIPVLGVMSSAGRVTDLQRLPDGRIVASGYGLDYIGEPPDYESKIVAVRLLPDGALDASFATGGIFSNRISPYGQSSQVIAVTPNGQPVLGGTYDPTVEDTSPFVARLDPNGVPDPNFGVGGFVLRGKTAPFGELFEDGGLDSWERFVTVSTAYEGNGVTTTVVTRYMGDLVPPIAAPVNRAPAVRMKKVPRKLRAPRPKAFSGTASDPDGDAIARVEVTLERKVRRGGKASKRRGPRCLALNAKGRFKPVRAAKGKPCPKRWLKAKGKARWSFKVKRSLPPGRYVVFARAVDARGLAGSTFSRKAGTRFAFRVLPAR